MNALPPAASGAVFDIYVGGANPVTQRVRPVAPKFREKLADLIKELLSTRSFDHLQHHGHLL